MRSHRHRFSIHSHSLLAPDFRRPALHLGLWVSGSLVGVGVVSLRLYRAVRLVPLRLAARPRRLRDEVHADEDRRRRGLHIVDRVNSTYDQKTSEFVPWSLLLQKPGLEPFLQEYIQPRPCIR